MQHNVKRTTGVCMWPYVIPRRYNMRNSCIIYIQRCSAYRSPIMLYDIIHRYNCRYILLLLYYIEGGKVSWIRRLQRAWRSSDLCNSISGRRQLRSGCDPNVRYTLHTRYCINIIITILIWSRLYTDINDYNITSNIM